MSIHVGNLHHDAHKGDLEHEFSRFGRIKSMWIARSPPGFAFIEYEDLRDAEDAVRDMDGREILGRRVRVDMKKNDRNEPSSRDGSKAESARGKPTRSEHRIIITGLSERTTWKDLKSLLKEKTDPVYVDLRGEGKAVAEFATFDDIAVSIEAFGDKDFKGSQIHIKKDENGGDERSESWQKYDSRPSTKRFQSGAARVRGASRDRDRERSRSFDRRGRNERPSGRSRSRSRDRRLDRRERSRDRGYDRRSPPHYR